MTLADTAKKLGVSFYRYVYDRVAQANQVPQLADLIAERAKQLAGCVLGYGPSSPRVIERILAEMASALGRLAIFVTAGNRLPVAIREIGQRPGGPFVQELRQVAADYGVSAGLEGALDAMGQRYPMPEILAFTGRMKVSLLGSLARRRSRDRRDRQRRARIRSRQGADGGRPGPARRAFS